ncbi:MOSC domain-containing protein [Rhizobium leguminosarum]|uniref:MOSC and FAD-binding oxidoreductase domain-containing protein n=1 Tax=Rhizobium leguminosarum TaxID=384 RepID=UPI00103042E2|nr:MOSC and FAD-binding oxidoreductase domain-containing protein [Rhizobium leguminosarum]QIO76225.1 MOSC domain-containing protein [Rhizobium leguminosarum bv. trifolii]QIO83243.1 MOSC domain-containing protein [Rhizobium leguminosarum bv. trifolii]TAU16504.1 MOSC domain-containing protein [Rhizobium leguminosarum]TAU34801.1 MOSC domain-containing protein [Rhizobium leguminosarum]TAX44021.1 MOSC domain-containing protein [Rhizobium leguminosarum]
MPRLLSVNVGLPQTISWHGREVLTGIWKAPVVGPRMARRLNIDGDGQGDLAGHGGENRAVYVYQMESYEYWKRILGRSDFVFGQFGENFTVEGLSDAETRVGDRYRIGKALFEVSQPRVTCYRLGIRMDVPEMAALLVSHGRPGFYMRVLEEGLVEAGDDVEQVAVGPEGLTISEVDALLYKPDHPLDRLEIAIGSPALSFGWRQSFEKLRAASLSWHAVGNAGLATQPQLDPAWEGFRQFRVSRKTHASSDVVTLEFEPSDGLPIGDALPGQFVVIELKPTASIPWLRSYSLSARPDGRHFSISVKREVGGSASVYIHNTLVVGDVVGLSAPRGAFVLPQGDGPIVLMSAGIGVTPVFAMLEAMAAQGTRREVWWLHGARNGLQHPFGEAARRLLSSIPRAHSVICYSSPTAADVIGRDYDRRSRLNSDLVESLSLPIDADYCICGPAGFMSNLIEFLRSAGVDAGRIHSEAFGPAASITPGIAAVEGRRPHQPAGEPGTGPLISFARSGLSVAWSSNYDSLLHLAEACDVPVRWSCRSGVCHTCETALISGAVAYEPQPLDKAANGNVLICCSKPKADLILDL